MSGNRSQQDHVTESTLSWRVASAQVVNRARKQSKKWAVGRSGLGRRRVRVRPGEQFQRNSGQGSECRMVSAGTRSPPRARNVSTSRVAVFDQSKFPALEYSLSLSLSFSPYAKAFQQIARAVPDYPANRTKAR